MQSNSSDNFVHCYNVEISNLFSSELQLISTKPLIKKQIKRFAKRVTKVWNTYINGHKISHLSTKLVISDSDIDEAYKSMNQIMTKIKNYTCTDWIVLDVNHTD